MLEVQLSAKPALFGAAEGLFGTKDASTAGIVLTASTQSTILQVLSPPGATGVAEKLQAWVGAEGAGLRPNGPGNWFVVCDAQPPRESLEALSKTLEGRAELLDQSHGRTRIKVSGPKVTQMLAKGTAIDLREHQFAPGQSAPTLFGHISAQLTRVSPENFEILVLSSFALSLWDSLIVMGREFGIQAHC
ncbi:sarcosine oxidase subunit gamma [Roseibium polysiphoniae]|uniref:Sarcosine oxidase subunit gamma n=1 Tax=Roseibium polysiphoniae TaxID=2571221 RepID=A0ABR9CE39_9HYPH|nr:sarcosine oxidase subunit gamma family protein [Roseibium polysiphoniae]MBD8877176.1 sarcosine oxidase subunit gamma [Roseibium polysiphoniae]